MLINYTTKELDLMARLMRAEAVGEGNLGMLMVGNVIVNRAIADCYTFKNIRTISEVVNQSPGGFSGVNSSLFVGSATTKEKELAERCLKGEYYYPATHALWFYAPGSSNTCKNTWYDQPFSGRYKSHCFYVPDSGICSELY
jgi:N-acetylmuramoyl-L-alanine amidase